MPGRAMRRHIIALAHNRTEILRRVMGARAVAWSEILGAGFGNPLVVDAAKFCDAFIADLTPENFADLRIPLTLIPTALHARPPVVFTEGFLNPPLPASLAL